MFGHLLQLFSGFTMLSVVLHFIINAEFVPINSLKLGEAMLMGWLGNRLLHLLLEEPGKAFQRGHFEYENQGMKWV